MKNKTYRLGTEPQEYELRTNYIGWLPAGYSDWSAWISEQELLRVKTDLSNRRRETPLRTIATLLSPDGTQHVVLTMHSTIANDTFPFSFSSEAHAKGWNTFYVVAHEDEPHVLFIIPLH